MQVIVYKEDKYLFTLNSNQILKNVTLNKLRVLRNIPYQLSI